MLNPRRFTPILIVLLGFLLPHPATATEPEAQTEAPVGAGDFLQLTSSDRQDRAEAQRRIEEQWQEGFAPVILEVARLVADRPFAASLLRRLEKRTGQRFGTDIDAWWQWLWNREYEPFDEYPEFKSAFYGFIDPLFRGYFSSDRPSTIRLDEVRWGGVQQDGIPPLRSPKMIPAARASYLEDDHVVFGVEINGDARAYPKRIMAWHEMFVDEVGGLPVAGVYCTLCGSMVLYETVHDGVEHHLGTSGFLYRSNKLMYDRDTQSLWNTLWGRPVIGPLVGQDITLARRSIVTTTWGEWRRRHPKSRVLALDTGFQRDYSEGAAYREYFATDELMFTVPKLDRRLKNKAEILALVFPDKSDEQLAISARFLKKRPLYQDRLGEQPFVVLTDPSGANRVYDTGGQTFKNWNGRDTVHDGNGTTWTVTEDQLTSTDGQTLPRLPAHRAFWFGWYSAYPETRLVK